MTQCKAPTIPGHLNAKQKRFCKEYLIDLNGTAAAKRAGYSAHTAKVQASRLLSNDAIRDYINSAAAAALERVDVSVGWVLNGIKNVVERCSQAVKPVLDSRGEQVMIEDQDGKLCPAYTFDATNTLRGLELLGRYHSLFSENVELTGQAGGSIQVITASMDSEAAAQIYSELMRR